MPHDEALVGQAEIGVLPLSTHRKHVKMSKDSSEMRLLVPYL